MVFCNVGTINLGTLNIMVTILILIDGFLQYENVRSLYPDDDCHNPYFNRWFSAITEYVIMRITDIGHNPYFNRWFSAI